MERETRSRCVARHPRSNCNCNIYNTGNILNSIIPVLYQSIVTCMHEINYAIVQRTLLYQRYQQPALLVARRKTRAIGLRVLGVIGPLRPLQVILQELQFKPKHRILPWLHNVRRHMWPRSSNCGLWSRPPTLPPHFSCNSSSSTRMRCKTPRRRFVLDRTTAVFTDGTTTTTGQRVAQWPVTSVSQTQ